MKPKLDIGLFVDLDEFPSFCMILSLNCFVLIFRTITSCKNWEMQENSAKSKNNPMSSFGLTKENMELSHTDEAVQKIRETI